MRVYVSRALHTVAVPAHIGADCRVEDFERATHVLEVRSDGKPRVEYSCAEELCEAGEMCGCKACVLRPLVTQAVAVSVQVELGHLASKLCLRRPQLGEKAVVRFCRHSVWRWNRYKSCARSTSFLVLYMTVERDAVNIGDAQVGGNVKWQKVLVTIAIGFNQRAVGVVHVDPKT